MTNRGQQPGNMVLGILAGGVLLLGAAAFLLVLNMGSTLPDGPTAGQQASAGQEGAEHTNQPQHPALPILPKRDFAALPLSVSEKKETAPQLAASLGMLGEGWALRPYDASDVWALRSDLKVCSLSAPSTSDCVSVFDGDGKGMWIYERGEEKIAVGLTYERGRNANPKGKISLNRLFGEGFHDVFKKGVDPKSWRPAGGHAGFDLSALPAPKAKDGTAANLDRMRAEIERDGKVKIYLASTTSRAVTLRVLDALDRRLIDAIIAPVVLSLAEAETLLSERTSNFAVLSEDALRDKVASMTRKQRNAHAMRFMKTAMSKGRTPDDYRILYQAKGQAGLAQTLDFLRGRLDEDHVGYDVLRYEQRKRLPIGACLQTSHGMYCKKNAQTLRIVQEIRRINKADEKSPLN